MTFLTYFYVSMFHLSSSLSKSYAVSSSCSVEQFVDKHGVCKESNSISTIIMLNLVQ